MVFVSQEHNGCRVQFLALESKREQTLQLLLNAPFKFSNHDVGSKFIYLCGKSPGSAFIRKRESGRISNNGQRRAGRKKRLQTGANDGRRSGGDEDPLQFASMSGLFI